MFINGGLGAKSDSRYSSRRMIVLKDTVVLDMTKGFDQLEYIPLEDLPDLTLEGEKQFSSEEE